MEENAKSVDFFGLAVFIIFWFIYSWIISPSFRSWIGHKTLLALGVVGLVGCTSVNYDRPPAAVQKTVASNASSVNFEKYAQTPSEVDATARETPSKNQKSYGRFIIEEKGEGYIVYGGEYVPEKNLPELVTAKLPHTLVVDYSQKTMSYYRRDEKGGYVPVISFAVVTPDASYLPEEVVRGVVKKINTAPSWCPTLNIRKVRKEEGRPLPAGCLPFGHKDNAMGDFKFEIDWKVPKSLQGQWSTIRVHGTGGYPRNFWTEETFGCTRLENHASQKLLMQMGNQAEKEGVEVFLLKGKVTEVDVQKTLTPVLPLGTQTNWSRYN